MAHTQYTDTHAEKTLIHQYTFFSLKVAIKGFLLDKFEYKENREYK